MRALVAVLVACCLLSACEKEPAFVTRCKKSVELKLWAPNTAKYGSLRDIAPNPDNPALVQLDKRGYLEFAEHRLWLAYVDSDNAVGATTRQYVVCVDNGDGPTVDVASSVGALSEFME